MSSERHKIAKEILDQARINFKKQREDASKEQPPIPRVEPKPVEKIEPSSNFYKVFSGLITGKQKANRDTAVSESPQAYKPPENVVNQNRQMEQVSQNLNEKSDLSQAIQSTVETEQKEEIPKPAQPSVFERLSQRKVAEDIQSEHKEDTPPAPNKENKQEEKVNSPHPVSVFEKLSRHASTNSN